LVGYTFFTKHRQYTLNINRSPHDYTPILSLFNLSIEDVHIICLFSEINFKIHTRNTRDTCLFHIPYYSQNYMLSSPINILLITGHNVNHNLDINLL